MMRRPSSTYGTLFYTLIYINTYICIHFVYICFFWERLKKYKWENSLIYVYCQSHIQRLLHDVFVDWSCKASLNTHINRNKIYALLNTKKWAIDRSVRIVIILIWKSDSCKTTRQETMQNECMMQTLHVKHVALSKQSTHLIKLTFQNYSAQGNHSVIHPFKNRLQAHVLCFNTAFFVWLK